MPTKTLVDTDSAQTLSAKTLTAPTINGTIAGTPAILPTGGTVAITLADAIGAIRSVKGYPQNQTGYAAAVAAAYAAGDILYWPYGVYTSTATIPNLHDVRHIGPGVIQRGSDLFYVDPSCHPGATNTLYVATTGSDNNDGLSSSQPRLTAQATGNTIYQHSYGDVTWKIQFAAGTYQATTYFNRAFPSPNRVQFLGAPVSDGTTPTTIFNSSGGASQSGLYIQGYALAYIEDIKFTDYNDSGTIAYSGQGAGIRVDAHSDVYTRNVFATNCDIGIKVAFFSQLRVQAGIISGNAINITAIQNSQYTIGYNGTAADINGINGTALLSSTNGILAQEQSSGHADYCYFGSNATGALIQVSSRLHALGSTFASNTVGVSVNTNSTYHDNPGTPNTYTSNGDDVICHSGGIRTGSIDASDGFGPGFREIDTNPGSTQSATPVTVYSRTLEAKELAVRNAHFKLRINGEVVGTANTKTVTVTLGATTLLTATIAASTTDYRIEVECYNRTAASSQKVNTLIIENGVLPKMTTIAIAEDLTASKVLLVEHAVSNVADRNDIELVELEIVR